MNFDVDLMADTADRIAKGCRQDIDSLVQTHGKEFAVSVMGNVGVNLLAGVLAAAVDDDARAIILLAVLKSLATMTMAEMSNYETEELLERIKKGSKC